jgi:hypothetical protein
MQRGSLKVWKNRQGVKVWRAQWREGGRGRTKILGTYADMDRSQAKAELAEILKPINTEPPTNDRRAVTLHRFVEDEYLLAKNRVWKASTRATTEQIIRTHVTDEIGARPISALTRRELQSLLDRRLQPDYRRLLSGILGGNSWRSLRWRHLTRLRREMSPRPL